MKYSIKDIKSITLSEAIRLRPGMYVGWLDQRGIESVIADLLNSLSYPINLGLMKFVLQGDTINIRIEVIESSKYRKPFESSTPKYDRFSQIYTLACLSSECKLLIEGEDNVVLDMTGNQGVFDTKIEIVDSYRYKHGRLLDFTFTPDKEIFKDLNLSYDYFLDFFQEQSYLLPKLIFIVDSHSNHVQFANRKGIFSYADMILHKLRHRPRIKIDESFSIDDYVIQWSICFMYYHSFGETIHFKAWVNNESILGGSVHEGIRSGLNYIFEKQSKENQDQIFVCLQIRGNTFSYQGALKLYLDMPLLEQKITDYIINKSKISCVSLDN